jgi:hypothetical protein
MGVRAGLPIGLGGVVILLLLSWLTGTDLLSLLGRGEVGVPPSASVPSSGRAATSPEDERLVDFVDAVMGDAQGTWQELLGARYRPTRVRLFRDAIQSACRFLGQSPEPFRLVPAGLGGKEVLLDQTGVLPRIPPAIVRLLLEAVCLLPRVLRRDGIVRHMESFISFEPRRRLAGPIRCTGGPGRPTPRPRKQPRWATAENGRAAANRGALSHEVAHTSSA